MTAAVQVDVKSIVAKVDSLVDEFWGIGALREEDGKTCLLGLLGMALYGTDWQPRYTPFDGSVCDIPACTTCGSQADPAALELAEYVASKIPASYDGEPYQQVYRYNDDELRSPAAVHNFLEGILSQ